MSREIEALAARLARGAAGDRARAVRLHDFVRDRIAFGFAPQLAAPTPQDTLAAGVGDTIAKTALFVALLRAIGLRAFEHCVTIDRELLHGMFPHGAHRLLPWEIAHAYTDVEIARQWSSLDSYALDRPLWHAAVARLAREGLVLGYGVHRLGTCRWTGAGDAFAQLASSDMVVEDHGILEDLAAVARDRAPGARAVWAPWSSLFACAGESVTAAFAQCVNDYLSALRAGPALQGAVAPR